MDCVPFLSVWDEPGWDQLEKEWWTKKRKNEGTNWDENGDGDNETLFEQGEDWYPRGPVSINYCLKSVNGWLKTHKI